MAGRLLLEHSRKILGPGMALERQLFPANCERRLLLFRLLSLRFRPPWASVATATGPRPRIPEGRIPVFHKPFWMPRHCPTRRAGSERTPCAISTRGDQQKCVST